MSVFYVTRFCKSANLLSKVSLNMSVLNSLLAASPPAAVPPLPCYFRLSWGQILLSILGHGQVCCVQLQVSVLDVRATELCVHLQETVDEAAKGRWLVVSQQRFVRVFCVTGCSCWQRGDCRLQHTDDGTT